MSQETGLITETRTSPPIWASEVFWQQPPTVPVMSLSSAVWPIETRQFMSLYLLAIVCL